MAFLLQIRRDTAANWTSADPVLALGEQGYEIDTTQQKVGDGVTPWTGLPYLGTGPEGGEGPPGPPGPAGGLFLNMIFRTASGVSDPGSGNVKVNNIDQTLATVMSVSSTTSAGNDTNFIWGTVFEGSYLGLWEPGSELEQVYYRVTAPPIDQGDWWQVSITHISGAGGLDEGADAQVFMIDNPLEKLPVDGTTGQVLTKASDTDFDTEWADPAESVPAGGTTGQGLIKASDTDYDMEWADPAESVPAGGDEGQVLAKATADDYDLEWIDMTGSDFNLDGGRSDSVYTPPQIISGGNS